PTHRWKLVTMANAIVHGKGFLTVAALLRDESLTEERLGSFARSIRQYLGKHNIPSLVEVTPASDPVRGARYLIQSYGMGPLYPNTILIGAGEEDRKLFDPADIIHVA